MLPRHFPLNSSVLQATKEGLPNMARFLYRNLSEFLRKWGIAFLAFSWIAGCVFGIHVYSDVGHILAFLMPGAFRSPLSIVGLLISVFLPLLFSVFAVYISQPGLLLLICFIKAFSVSFVSCGIFALYGDGAWILRLVVLFHDFFASTMLLIFSMVHISGKPLCSREFLYYGIPCVLAAAAEYYILGPFLTELIYF